VLFREWVWGVASIFGFSGCSADPAVAVAGKVEGHEVLRLSEVIIA
jgi:hypothetical protein